MAAPAPPPASHWKAHAAQWAQVGSPLRPAQEDAELYWDAAAAALADAGASPARALLLGVTPELTALPWPADSSLLAADLSRDMLRGIWSPRLFPGRACAGLNADWLALPLAATCCDLALGDGCLSIFPDAKDLRRLARELHRVLRPGAGLVLRLFCPPQVAESPDAVLDDLRRGRVGNFHAFKWRLVMAVHAADPAAGLDDVWRRWEAAFPRAGEAAALGGWTADAVRTLEAYRGAAARYGFHRLDQVRAVLAPEFGFVGAELPGYELGGRCPVARFRRLG